MSLRIAIVYREKDIFVEFSQEKFIEILEKYMKKFKNVKDAVEAVAMDLKREVVRR